MGPPWSNWRSIHLCSVYFLDKKTANIDQFLFGTIILDPATLWFIWFIFHWSRFCLDKFIKARFASASLWLGTGLMLTYLGMSSPVSRGGGSWGQCLSQSQVRPQHWQVSTVWPSHSCAITVSANQRTAWHSNDQSEVRMRFYWPIRGEYEAWLANQKAAWTLDTCDTVTMRGAVQDTRDWHQGWILVCNDIEIL